MTVYEMILTLRLDVYNENDLDLPIDWIGNIIDELQEDAEGIATITGNGTIKKLDEDG